jgi:GMP synthase (glutamine-hydrolysing)
MIINEKGEQEPFQIFAATFEDATNAEVTGLVDGKRTYDIAKCISGDWDYKSLIEQGRKITKYTRLFFELGEKEGKFDVVIRSVNSIDARTATVTELPIELINDLRDKLLKIKDVKRVFFDVTEKPPATIEYV